MKVLFAILSVGLGLIGAAPVWSAPSKTPDVIDTSFVTADGARTLQESITINAPVAVLWKAFTVTSEYQRWNAAVSAIDLRVGGSLEASYDTVHRLGDPDNIKHRIITFLPERLIIFQNTQAPGGLPHAEIFQRTVTVLEYQRLGASKTRVMLSSTGWPSGADAERLYAFFHDGNGQLLQKLKTVYEPAAKVKS